MKKSILLVAMGLLLVNGCSNKTVTPKSVTSKAKKVVNEKKVKQEKQWGAPTISEAEAKELYGFYDNE